MWRARLDRLAPPPADPGSAGDLGPDGSEIRIVEAQPVLAHHPVDFRVAEAGGAQALFDGVGLRQHPAVLDLKFAKGLKRPEKTNAIEGYLKGEMTPEERKVWEAAFKEVPDPLSEGAKQEWLERLDGISLSSDALIPFRDNIDRAVRTGVKYVVQAGGSVQDDNVIAAADEYGMVMILSGVRLFHH